MTELSSLHPAVQARIVAKVAAATAPGPSFLRRVKGFANLPFEEKRGIVKRLLEGGWKWALLEDDLVVTGGVS